MSDDSLALEATVKKNFADFKDEVMKEATHILSVRMPQKISYFNKLVSEKPSSSMFSRNLSEDELAAAQANPWLRFVADKIPELPYESSQGEMADTVRPPAKRPKLINGGEKESVIFTAGFPAHPQIFKMTEEIKHEVAELIEMAGAVKLFIQLNVPRIEGGNNFGVQIQEEAIQELGRVEDGAFSVCTAIVDYFTSRAALASKIIKYPNVQDYKEALRELDEKKWMLLKVTRIDMRNNYAMLYDLLSKNWERVVKPRNSEGNSMIY